jgi:hypothetical protein
VDARGLLAAGCDVESDIGDLGAVLEHHAVVPQPLDGGNTSDSYWLYLVNFSVEKSGIPAIWWMNRCRYSFISSAECHSPKANIVRQ